MTLAASSPLAGTAPDQEYPVFLYEGRARLFFRLRSQGVRLAQGTIAWRHEGRERHYDFGEIASIRLQVMHVHKSGDLGTCMITFRDGQKLTLTGGTAYGYADEPQARAYTASIRDLHARLAASRVSAIRYRAGSSEGMHTGAVVSVVLGGLFFIALPVVLLFVVRRWEVLGVLAAGIGFIWPFWRKVEANRPRDYAPDAVPAELLP